MSLAAIVDALIAAGCSPEQIGAAVRAHEAKVAEAGHEAAIKAAKELSEKRAAAAERKRKSRASRDVTVTPCDIVGQAVTSCDQKGSDGFNESITLTSLPPKTPSSLRSDVSAGAPKKPKPNDREVLEILETCLTPQTAADLVAHRKALKKPMTEGSAKALAKSFVAFGDPEAAAQAMMANGWQGFNPAWMQNQARAGPRDEPKFKNPHLIAMMLDHGIDPNGSRENQSEFVTIDADPVKPASASSAELFREPDQSAEGGKFARFYQRPAIRR